MNILVLAARDRKNRNVAGGDLTLTEVSQWLARHGHSVTYLCSGFRGGAGDETVGSVRILRKGNVWTASILAAIFYLRNRNKFDLVLEEVIGGLRIPYFAPLYIRKPLVAVWYQRNDLIFRFQYNAFTAGMLKLLEYSLARLHRSKLVLCPSRRTIKDLSTIGIPTAQMRLYVPGLDGRIQRLSSQALRSSRENLIVWLGKIRRYKRTEDAIFTMDRLVKMFPASRMLVIGIPEDEKYMRELENLRNRLDLRKEVDFKFGISEEEKGEVLLRSRVLLVTSPIEGFGNVVSEANACGTPAVVTDGVPFDVVIQGVNGFRVDFGDVEGMAEACRTILEDEPMFRKLSRASIECAKNRSWDNTAETFNSVMEEASSSVQRRC